MNQISTSIPSIIARRKILGISAVFLPWIDEQTPDWESFQGLLEWTLKNGLIPAVNMDTGFAASITEQQREDVLQLTYTACKQITRKNTESPFDFVAGVFVSDDPSDSFNQDAYFRGIDAILTHGGTPIFFPSFGIKNLQVSEIVNVYQSLGEKAGKCLLFELGEMFVPFGKIFELELFKELIQIDSIVGSKHSSLSRQLEWDRLKVVQTTRPEFKLFTGNDHAIDMVMYGSDYLLGLSAFCPDWFALRDYLWEMGDPAFYEVNDLLQYLGRFTFRDPVPAYRHNAAQFLKLRGKIKQACIPAGSKLRPEADIQVLEEIYGQLERLKNDRIQNGSTLSDLLKSLSKNV